MNSTAMTEFRFVDIETKLAYQEDAVDELTKALRAQEKRIEQLEGLCRLLIERLGETAPAATAVGAVDSEAERPPHY